VHKSKLSFHIFMLQSKLEFRVQHDGYSAASSLSFETLDLWGFDRKITNVKVDEVAVDDANIEFDTASKVRGVLHIVMLSCKWRILPWPFSWHGPHTKFHSLFMSTPAIYESADIGLRPTLIRLAIYIQSERRKCI
jgi:hypothetical protein